MELSTNPFSNKTVLVVDDQEMFRETLSDELQSLGFSVHTAEDGDDALRRCAEQAFDLVISDIRMPKCDGIDLLKGLRRISPSLPPIILMTGYSTFTQREALTLGADAYLDKPIAAETLMQVLLKLNHAAGERWRQPAGAVLPSTVLTHTYTQVEGYLGHGGIALPVGAPLDLLPFGSLVGFDVTFTKGILRQLRGVGRVCWSDAQDATVGLEFCWLDDACLRDYLQLIALLAPIPRILPAASRA